MTPRTLSFAATGAVLLLGSQAAFGQLSMTWTTIDGGGGTCSAGSMTLSCTIGQPDAGPVMSSGALYVHGRLLGLGRSSNSPRMRQRRLQLRRRHRHRRRYRSLLLLPGGALPAPAMHQPRRLQRRWGYGHRCRHRSLLPGLGRRFVLITPLIKVRRHTQHPEWVTLPLAHALVTAPRLTSGK